MILLAFLAIAAVGAAAVLAAGRTGRGRRGTGGAKPYIPGPAAALGEPDPRLPPVLLPEHPEAADIADLRFSVALRGYRMDEVDAVLARLAQALLERDAALAQLRETGAAQPGTGRHAQVSPEDPAGRKDP